MGRTSADVVALRTSSSTKSRGSISRFGYGDPALTMALTLQSLGVCIKCWNDDGDSGGDDDDDDEEEEEELWWGSSWHNDDIWWHNDLTQSYQHCQSWGFGMASIIGWWSDTSLLCPACLWVTSFTAFIAICSLFWKHSWDGYQLYICAQNQTEPLEHGPIWCTKNRTNTENTPNSASSPDQLCHRGNLRGWFGARWTWTERKAAPWREAQQRQQREELEWLGNPNDTIYIYSIYIYYIYTIYIYTIYIHTIYIYYILNFIYTIYIYTPICLLKAPQNDETQHQRMFQLVWVTIEGNCNMWIIFPWPLSRIDRGSNGFSNGFTEVARLACCAAWSLMGRRKQRLSWSFTSAWSSVVTQWGSNGVQWVDWFNMI